jgi:hypothetical protein
MMTSLLKLLKLTAIDGRRIEQQSSNYLALITYFMMGHLVIITRQLKSQHLGVTIKSIMNALCSSCCKPSRIINCPRRGIFLR